jgi:hypothetical protein
MSEKRNPVRRPTRLQDAEKRIEELEQLLVRKNKIILLLALGDEPQQLHCENVALLPQNDA